MAVNALKDKLESRLYETQGPEITGNKSIGEAESNIIPFGRQEEDSSGSMASVVPDFAITLNEAKQRIVMLQEFVRDMMIPDVDYGYIPHCDKPSLFKSGGEKLCDIFGFSKQLEISNRFEDWEKGIFHYEVKAILVSKKTGLVEAEGIGSCNSKEGKYAKLVSYSIANTILKMAKKRAFIDAVLSATRSSGLFNQDIEDEEAFQVPRSNEKPSSQSQKSTRKSSGSTGSKARKNIENLPQNNEPPGAESSAAFPISKQQFTRIQSIVSTKKIPINKVKEFIHERYHVSESKHLTGEQAEDFIKYLNRYNGR